MADNFSSRLRVLIGSNSCSAFARKVGLGESLIRKYLSGSEPSVSKALQICRRSGADLNWLLTGQDPAALSPGYDEELMNLVVSVVTETFSLSSQALLRPEKLYLISLLYHYAVGQAGRNRVVSRSELSEFLRQQDIPG